MGSGFQRKHATTVPYAACTPIRVLVLCRGTSVKKTVDPSKVHTARDFFTETVAAVNTDVSRAVRTTLLAFF